jgi:hypothetical protein
MKGKRRTAATITLMTILAVVILITYYYWTHRTEPLSSENNLTEVQKLVNKDLDLYYPGTPREVVKLFASMMQTLYNNPEDKDIGALALKLRDLYDQEFLNSNPEDAYLSNLDSELKVWKEKNRTITNYLLINEEQEKVSEIDGVKYATEYISFTIQENSKSTEIWNVLLRQAVDGQWKILGWEPVSENIDNNGN